MSKELESARKGTSLSAFFKEVGSFISLDGKIARTFTAPAPTDSFQPKNEYNFVLLAVSTASIKIPLSLNIIL